MKIRIFQRLSRFAVCVVFVAALSASHVLAAEAPADSLFFTPDETQKINALVGRNGQDLAARPDIHLGAIMYYGPGDWTLWLQGERWTSTTAKAGIRILEVQPDEVRLSVSAASDAVPREITLRPHQTYQIGTDKIIEGDSE